MFIYKYFIMSIKIRYFIINLIFFITKKKKEKEKEKVDSLVLNPQMEKNEYIPF